MITVQITQQMIDAANEQVRQFNDRLARNPNFTGSISRHRGFVAEHVVRHVFPTAHATHFFWHCDLEVAAHCGTVFQLGNHMINVKSNNYEARHMPLEHYTVGVISRELPEADDDAAKIDLVFVKLSLNRMIAYLVGWLALVEFLRRSVRVTPDQNPHLKIDNNELPISELNPIETLMSAPTHSFY